MALSSACNRNKELKCQTLALKHRTWGVKKHTWEYLPTKRVQGILTDWWVFLTNQKMGFPFKKDGMIGHIKWILGCFCNQI